VSRVSEGALIGKKGMTNHDQRQKKGRDGGRPPTKRGVLVGKGPSGSGKILGRVRDRGKCGGVSRANCEKNLQEEKWFLEECPSL